MACEESAFVTRRHRSSERSERSQCNRIRDEIAEELSNYAEALIDEASYWASMIHPTHTQEITSQTPLKGWMTTRYHQLETVEHFLVTGSLEHRLSTRTLKKVLYISDILEKIVCTQRALMKSIRALLLGDTTCCFVKTHNKQILQRYLQAIRRFMTDAYELSHQHPL